MEPGVVQKGRRGRKRKRKEDENVSLDQPQKKQTRSKVLVGRYVKKEFEGSGVFIGKIVYYDSGLYRVDYEDGDCEDLDSGEVKQFLIGDDDQSDNDFIVRRNNLDELVLKKYAKNAVEPAHVADKVEVETTKSSVTEFEINGAEVEGGDADSSSDSCEYDLCLEVETPPFPPPPLLPPSSGNVGIPEDCVSYLFSVYSFLRSFSIRLFLSPFSLDEFVGALNCSVPNTLLDAIHVALMRALRSHFEMLSLDGSELASKCLRLMDWSLLDTLTWPVFLIQYLMIMRYTEGLEWRGFYLDALERDYYTLSIDRKLKVLQILCDDVLDSAELRAEVDMREESEVGSDSDGVKVIAPENGPRRVHPRYSKTSACKDQEAVGIISESNVAKSSFDSSPLGIKSTVLCTGADVAEDGNGDECRLCGMDGILLCCDGCPSAYHSRCIGVSKMSIPEGAWYCPECIINKSRPHITRTTFLRGAEIFGIDSYEQVFLGTCDHLLVLKDSSSCEPCFRYYNQNDIEKVLQALCSSMEHSAIYLGICKGILRYWEIPENVLLLAESVGFDRKLLNRNEDGKESCIAPEIFDADNVISGVTRSTSDNMVVSHLENTNNEPGFLESPLEKVNEFGLLDHQTTECSFHFGNCKGSEDIKVETAQSAGSVCLQHDESLGHKSSPMEYATCTSGNSDSKCRGHVSRVCFMANISSQTKESNCQVGGRGFGNSADFFLYMGSSFKSQAYTNLYNHGDFAASAAANLAILSSEENRVPESHTSSNYRKLVSANYSLQIKAFSSAAKRFFWPNSEKRLVEVPRERCGWCLSCKAAVTSKRGCLLNAAASNAIKGALKTLLPLRPVKIGEGRLASIATYVIFLEESLCGLTVGPFLSSSYRKKWRKQVEEAATFSAIKAFLLELEENIRSIAFSADWVKLVEDKAVESTVVQSITNAVGSTQKRGPGRRGRKQAITSEVADEDGEDISSGFVWWRGSMLSKHIFQKGILQRSMIRKAARLGGSRKIPGIHYVEGFEVPKRSRQFVWRAAVELGKNASQLALQVRCLDHHVRWSDLVRPEQSLDGKGPETEASAFRNAFIADKKIVENKISYGVTFENQKHLPSRVMKNVLEVEQSEDGKEKHWFLEARIPLYLIKEYEEKVKVILPLADNCVNTLSELQRRQLKASRKDIFSYLSRKRDNLPSCCCASCQQEVILGNAVKCSACEGYCHEQCTISSTVHKNKEFGFLIICKQCYQCKAITPNENINESPTSPLVMQGKEFRDAVTVAKGGKQNGFKRQLASNGTSEQSSEIKSANKNYSLATNKQRKLAYIGTLEQSSEMKSANNNSSLATNKQRKLSNGLIWRKKNGDDTGIEFRLKYILLKDNPNRNFLAPVCHLCTKPYRSDLMYICCETCTKWYHAEAVELTESKVLEVVGFKCCRCRRIRSPVCPYTDLESKKNSETKKPRPRAPKQANLGMDSDSETIYEQVKDMERDLTPVLATSDEVINVQEDDPLLFSLSTVEQVKERNTEVGFEWNAATVSGPGPQKLPVRRHMKSEKELDALSANNPPFESSTPYVRNVLNPAEESTSHVEWDVSTDGFDDRLMFDYEGLNYEDMEFEPQTYFSFTELLATDDDVQSDGLDPSGDLTVKWEDPSAPSQDCNPGQYEMGITYDQQEPMFSVEAAVDIVPCRVCSLAKPNPDLSCQICGLWMHSHCSPWDESLSGEGGWRCGNCREWQ